MNVYNLTLRVNETGDPSLFYFTIRMVPYSCVFRNMEAVQLPF